MFAEDCEKIAKGLDKLKTMNVYNKGGHLVQVVSEIEELLEKVNAHTCETDGESVAEKDELISQLYSQITNLQNGGSVDIKAYEDMKETILDKVSDKIEENNSKMSETLTEHEQELWKKLETKLETELPFLIESAFAEIEKKKEPWYVKIFKKSEKKEIEVEKEKEVLKVKN